MLPLAPGAPGDWPDFLYSTGIVAQLALSSHLLDVGFPTPGVLVMSASTPTDRLPMPMPADSATSAPRPYGWRRCFHPTGNGIIAIWSTARTRRMVASRPTRFGRGCARSWTMWALSRDTAGCVTGCGDGDRLRCFAWKRTVELCRADRAKSGRYPDLPTAMRHSPPLGIKPARLQSWVFAHAGRAH